jgi:VanZ family protein
MGNKHTIRWTQFIPAAIWFLIVLALMCTPRKDLPDTDLLKIKLFDKAVHLACFAILVWLFYYPLLKTPYSTASKLNYLTRLTHAAIVWGITTELIQRYFIPGRSFDLFDWLADSLGAIAACIVLKRRLKKV